MISKDKHIILLNWNIEGLNRDLNEVQQTMERVFAFGFNTTMGEAKYFFPNHVLNFDLFYLSKFMDEIMVGISGAVADHIEKMANHSIEMDANHHKHPNGASYDLNPHLLRCLFVLCKYS